ncbi:ATP-binding protein [Helicobacter sp. 13S00477-4]|uniref:ATP-binding protein n=1 Tax=Helicobacter sp. 13S00477-4 TaxID=1905759 RepID=UPI000BA59F4E|nr:ATP-binding protein [Helicobacter sp. 13S00477-4]PAF51949.1 hypothetical protein BKH44_04620 [Helicobacter sp. 13S00477-4]
MDFECDWESVKAVVFRAQKGGYFHAVKDFDPIDLKNLLGLEKEIESLEKNTLAFSQGSIASNVLLWGARGCGKSSMMKGVFTKFLFEIHSSLRVVEVEKANIFILPYLIDDLREKTSYRFIIYCDDLSFEANDDSYKSLKSVLEGSLEKKPQNILMYATSNRRHLIAEVEQTGEIHQNDVFDEVISLSDRFGLSMGIYTLGTEEYLNIVRSLCVDEKEFESIRQFALNYAAKKGNRSGRSAKEFFKLYKNNIF